LTDITHLMEQAGAGDGRLQPELFDRIYAELRQLAASCMRRERADHTLQPTALVAEAYLRLTGGRPVSWRSNAHFFHIAGRVMRQILVEHARERSALKRGGNLHKLELDDSMAFLERDPARMIAIDDALGRLAEIDARAVQVVELRFFAGLTVDETAATLAVSAKTVKRDWEFARVWLEKQLRNLERA